jgi:predicted DNA-binding transcriptional regulator
LNKDRILGLSVLVASLISLVLYGWLLFISQWSMLALELTCFIAIALVLGIIAWIGYTLTTTLPPKPIREDEEHLEPKGNAP